MVFGLFGICFLHRAAEYLVKLPCFFFNNPQGVFALHTFLGNQLVSPKLTLLYVVVDY